MNEFFGHDEPWRQFSSSLNSGKLHHGWILAGARGVGKAGFAMRAAAALVDPDGRFAHLIERETHPDILVVKRLPKEAAKDDEDTDSSGEIKRSITIHQIRDVISKLTMRTAMGGHRAIIIDAAEDIERTAPNTLLKILEEPPAGTYFFLVSHASDRLLPTIRSRCQMLRFEPLSDDNMARALGALAPDAGADEIAISISAGNGSPGQAVDFLGLDLHKLEDIMTSIVTSGDRSNALRCALAEQLSTKAAQTRYEAFLRRAPSLLAEIARRRPAREALTAADAWHAASTLATRATALSLDKQSVVLQMGCLLASLQPNKAA